MVSVNLDRKNYWSGISSTVYVAPSITQVACQQYFDHIVSAEIDVASCSHLPELEFFANRAQIITSEGQILPTL